MTKHPACHRQRPLDGSPNQIPSFGAGGLLGLYKSDPAFLDPCLEGGLNVQSASCFEVLLLIAAPVWQFPGLQLPDD